MAFPHVTLNLLRLTWVPDLPDSSQPARSEPISCYSPSTSPFPLRPVFTEPRPPSALSLDSTLLGLSRAVDRPSPTDRQSRAVDRASPTDRQGLGNCSDHAMPTFLRRSSRLAAKGRGMKMSPLQRARDLLSRKLKFTRPSYKTARLPTSSKSPTSVVEPLIDDPLQAANDPSLPSSSQHPPRSSANPDPSRATSLPLTTDDIKKMSSCGIIDQTVGPPAAQHALLAATSTSLGNLTERA